MHFDSSTKKFERKETYLATPESKNVLCVVASKHYSLRITALHALQGNTDMTCKIVT